MAANKLEGVESDRAHQIVCCNEDGQLVGDGILFRFGPKEFFICRAPFVVNWIRFHAEMSDLDVETTVDERSPVCANGHGNERRFCRFQIQGPQAWALIEKLNGGALEDVKFFHTTETNIGKHRVNALRHGMAGAPGLEIWTSWELRDQIRDTIIEAGQEFGLVLVGALAYLTSGVESGWIQAVLPGIYSGESTRAYREWLPASELERRWRLTGSYDSPNVEDYYRTPYGVGYQHIVNLEHEFIGRDALAAVDPSTERKKVTLVWEPEDAAQILTTMLTPDGANVKPLHLPIMADKVDSNYDRLTVGDELVGIGHYTTYTANDRAIITLSTVDPDVSLGNEVVLHWGDVGGGVAPRDVPADDITEIRAVVSPVPYSPVAREAYAVGWRGNS